MALPEIAHPTIAELKAIINENIANNIEGGIDPLDDRAVRNSIVNYLNNNTGTTLKSKVVTLGSFEANRNYILPLSLPVGGTSYRSIDVDLLCKIANNGYSIGDIVKPPAPYVNGGVGIQYNDNDLSIVKIMIHNEIWITTAYNPAPAATVGNLLINPTQWSIRLTIYYV